MSSTEISAKAREWRGIQTFIKQLQDEADTLKAAITAEMDARGVDTLQADIFTIKHVAYTSHRVDTKAIQAELPDIAARYTRAIEARRFQIA